MKKLFSSLLLIATLTPFHGQAQQASTTLTGLLAKQGLAGAKLERRFAVVDVGGKALYLRHPDSR